MTGLIDKFGRPLASKRQLADEVAAPTLTGVRSIWHEPVASGLTPPRLARILRDSMEPGADATDFLTLAEEMEEREPQYRMALTQRKLALRNIECVVEAASNEEKDLAMAAEVRSLIDTTTFRNVLMDMADAIAKGYSVCEIVWNTRAVPWKPAKIEWRDQRHFQFDKETGRELRLREDGEPDGRLLPAAKFITHIPKLKSGLPLRQGLARTAAWIFMLKSFSIKDWMAFLEVYGMPFRVGKYGPGATEADKRALLRAVANVAADGGAIIPESMLLEFIETKANASGDNAFKGMAGYLDEQFAKLIIGQTMTSADGSSRSQAEVHDDIRIEIKRADADDIAASAQRDLVEPFVQFNWGAPKNGFPQLTFPVPDPEDLKALLEATRTFIDLGGRVPAAPVREKLGWRDPEEGEEVLERGAAAPEDAEDAGDREEEDADPEKETARRHCPSCGEVHHARMVTAEEPTGDFATEMLNEWEPQLEAVLRAVRERLDAATNLEDFRDRLADLPLGTDLEALIDRLAAATFTARIEGDHG